MNSKPLYSVVIIVFDGGLSIRRINAFELLKSKLKFRKLLKINEDVFFSYMGKKGKIRCAPPQFAEKIFNETSTKTKESLPDVYGFHALNKWNTMLANFLKNKYQY